MRHSKKIYNGILIAAFSLLVFASFFGTTVATARAAEPPIGKTQNTQQVKALQLKQTFFFAGDSVITIAPTAIRFTNVGKLKFTLIASAPDWQITVFRDDDKTYYIESLDSLASTGLWADILVKRHERIWNSPTRAANVKFMQFISKRISAGGQVLEYLPTQGLTAPQVAEILYAIYKTPINGGIPLYFSKRINGVDWISQMKENDLHREILRTNGAKTISVSSSIFKCPSGYRRVKAMQEVLCSLASRNSCDDFGDIFEAGTNSDKKGPTKSTTKDQLSNKK